MKFTLFLVLFISLSCASEVNVDQLKTLKTEGKLAELEEAVEMLVVDSTLSSEQVELPLFYLIETKAKLNKMKALPPLMKRFITNYPNSDSLSRVYYIAAIYGAKRKNYISAIKACDRGLAVVLSSDTTTRSLLLKTCTKLVERVYDLKKIDDALAFSTADILINLLLARQEVLKEQATHPMAGYPDGRYVSFQDFKEKKAIPIPGAIISRSKDRYKKYRGMAEKHLEGSIPPNVPSYSIKVDVEGKLKKWKDRRDGEMFAFATNGTVYLHNDGWITSLNIYNNYSWYKVVQITGGPSHVPTGASGFTTVHLPYGTKTKYYVLDMQTGEKRYLSNEYMRELLVEYPDLLKNFENEGRKKKNRIKYFRQFLFRSNPDPKSYHPKN